MAINVIITDVGISEINNAEQAGTAKVWLKNIGLGATYYPASKTNLAMGSRFKTITAGFGGKINGNSMQITMTDDSDDEYDVHEIGIYTESGKLFALYSQETPIISKTKSSVAMLAFNFFLSNVNPEYIELSPPVFDVSESATETREGIAEIATVAEAKAGTDDTRFITPKKLDAVIEGHDNIVHRSGVETITGQKTFSVSPIAPTPANGDNSTKIATTAWVTTKAKEYLPLAGGTMSGTIITVSGTAMKRNDETTCLQVCGGTDSSSATLWLCGKNFTETAFGSDAKGSFVVRAATANDKYIHLMGKPDGSLTWSGKNIVRSVNNVNADSAGNVNLSLNFLPLSGGTLTGSLYFSQSGNIKSATTDYIMIMSGENHENSPHILLRGANATQTETEIPGEFFVIANDGTNVSRMVGRPNGSLSWDGKNIVRSVNGVNADIAGNVSVTAYNVGALPLSGGQMTSTKAMSRDVANSFLGLHGGTGENNDGAQLYLCGANHPDMPGMFQLHARNSNKVVTLQGNLDGTLNWGDKYVLNNSFTLPTDTGAIHLTAGTSNTGGAYIRLYGKDHVDGKGQFSLTATDGTNTKALNGKPDGTLTWGGKDITLGYPNYAAATTATTANSYKAPADGWIYAEVRNVNNNFNRFYINGKKVGYGNGSDAQGASCFVPVKTDDVITATSANVNDTETSCDATYIFYPNR